VEIQTDERLLSSEKEACFCRENMRGLLIEAIQTLRRCASKSDDRRERNYGLDFH
jgi:hypothetical protein